MKIYDVTFPIGSLTPIYPGDPAVSIEAFHSIAHGDAANSSFLHFGSHTATHVDAPNHFVEGGRRVDALDLEKLIGAVRVVEIPLDARAVTAEHLENLPGVERVLFKTRNSAFWNEPEKGFRADYTFIAPEAAEKLVEMNVKLVGIDYLSVEEFGAADFATHKILLEREIVIIESLDLRSVAGGDYEIICLPLKFVGGSGDGAPARTILRQM